MINQVPQKYRNIMKAIEKLADGNGDAVNELSYALDDLINTVKAETIQKAVDRVSGLRHLT